MNLYSTLGSPSVGPAGNNKLLLGHHQNPHPMALDVRWDTWENGVPGSASSPSSEDELLYLLDVIHRKTVRLRKDFETKVRTNFGTACARANERKPDRLSSEHANDSLHISMSH